MITPEIQSLPYGRFTSLHRSVNEYSPTGNWKDRGPRVMGLPMLQRDLHFVLDEVVITSNACMGAWIHYHIDDAGWIDAAARAFQAIGHPTLGDHLKECRERYRDANGALEKRVDMDLSAQFWQTEGQLLQGLHRHLVNANLVFRRPRDFHRILEQKTIKHAT